MMTSLSSMAAEAMQRVGRLPEPERRSLQQALADLCASHWRALRGRQPTAPLARALWDIAPPLADLCADLYASRDARLDAVLQGRTPAQAFALLVLAAIEGGDAEAAHAAYVPMMLFESPAAGARYVEAVAASLHGRLEAPPLHRHASAPPLTKALSVLVAHTGRSDLPGLLAVIGLLLASQVADDKLEQLRAALGQIGVRFTALGEGRVEFELHGHAHRPATMHHLGEALAEVRRTRLG